LLREFGKEWLDEKKGQPKKKRVSFIFKTFLLFFFL